MISWPNISTDYRPVVGPEDDIRVNDLTVSLPRSAASLQTGRLEVVLPENLDPALDGEVVQLVGHLQLEQVVQGEEVEDAAVDCACGAAVGCVHM